LFRKDNNFRSSFISFFSGSIEFFSDEILLLSQSIRWVCGRVLAYLFAASWSGRCDRDQVNYIDSNRVGSDGQPNIVANRNQLA
jgi:hypothetical protein